MESSVKILVVEDEMLIGAKISLFLTELGYKVTALLPRAEEALLQVMDNMPDIALLDVRLKGEMDGIALAEILYTQHKIPVIFLTANSDDSTFNRAKAARPFAFLAKPFKKPDLQRAIELTISRLEEIHQPPNATKVIKQEEDNTFILPDRIFIRHKDRMFRILFDSILYVEAERNYCHIHTKEKDYLLTMPMKSLESRLPASQFQRIHRSHIANLNHVDEVSEGYVYINGKTLPLSHTLKAEFLQRFRMI
ncbi:MAG: LytTR family transcriptional regulator DNA-binding domain-containing protein [Saprospiraceae bacterium]